MSHLPTATILFAASTIVATPSTGERLNALSSVASGEHQAMVRKQKTYFRGAAVPGAKRKLQGSTSTASSQWYASNGSAKCVQSCPVSPSNPACGGTIGWGTHAFATAEYCCAIMMSSETTCIMESLIGLPDHIIMQNIRLQNMPCPPLFDRFKKDYKQFDKVTVYPEENGRVSKVGRIYECVGGPLSQYCNSFQPSERLGWHPVKFCEKPDEVDEAIDSSAENGDGGQGGDDDELPHISEILSDAPPAGSDDGKAHPPSDPNMFELSANMLFNIADETCTVGDIYSFEQSSIVVKTVEETVAKRAMEEDPPITNTIISFKSAECISMAPSSRHLTEDHHTSDHYVVTPPIRKRQRGTSSGNHIHFNMDVSGQYPMCRSGASCSRPDLGAITEDSINRDKEGFAKSLNDRIKEVGGGFHEIDPDDIKVEAVDTSSDIQATEQFQPQILEEETGLSYGVAMVIAITAIVALLICACCLGRCLFYMRRHKNRENNRDKTSKREGMFADDLLSTFSGEGSEKDSSSSQDLHRSRGPRSASFSAMPLRNGGIHRSRGARFTESLPNGGIHRSRGARFTERDQTLPESRRPEDPPSVFDSRRGYIVGDTCSQHISLKMSSSDISDITSVDKSTTGVNRETLLSRKMSMANTNKYKGESQALVVSNPGRGNTQGVNFEERMASKLTSTPNKGYELVPHGYKKPEHVSGKAPLKKAKREPVMKGTFEQRFYAKLQSERNFRTGEPDSRPDRRFESCPNICATSSKGGDRPRSSKDDKRHEQLLSQKLLGTGGISSRWTRAQDDERHEKMLLKKLKGQTRNRAQQGSAEVAERWEHALSTKMNSIPKKKTYANDKQMQGQASSPKMNKRGREHLEHSPAEKLAPRSKEKTQSKKKKDIATTSPDSAEARRKAARRRERARKMADYVYR